MRTVRSEHLVLAAGLVVIGLGVVQAGRDRPNDWWIWASGLALIAFGLFRHQLRHMKLGPSGIELAVERALEAPAEQLAKSTRDLKLLISTGMPVGGAELAMGTSHIIQVTAVNTSERAIGLSSLGLSLSDGRYIPVIETLPTSGNVPLPAILQPQQTATVWLDHDATRDRLAQENVRLDSIMAHLADGTTRTEPVPPGWRKLGE